MNTKITKNQIIQALKIRMNSVMIEKKFLDEDFLNGHIDSYTYDCLLKNLLKDLQHYIEML